MGTESGKKSGPATEGAPGEPPAPTAAASPGAGPTFHFHIAGSTIGAIGAGTDVTGTVNTSGQPASPNSPGTSSAGSSPERSSGDRPIDFAILTAIEVERRAVCAALGFGNEHRVHRGSRVYWRGRLPLRDGASYEVVVAQPSDMGNIEAALLAADVVRDWKPGAALLVGIAASTDKDVKLGDIVVGRTVYYYEHGKVTPEGTRPQPEMIPADSTLLNKVTGISDWDGTVPVARPSGGADRPKIHRDVIASGEKVIAHAAVRDEIASGHRRIRAIEMEGWGFSKAIWQSPERVRHIDIRGICDDGSPTKDDRWHAYAAASAAAFARHFLQDRPLQPLDGPGHLSGRVELEQGSPPSALIEDTKHEADPRIRPAVWTDRARPHGAGTRKGRSDERPPRAEAPPNNLPPRRDFIGRTDELDGISQSLIRSRHVSVTQGGQTSIFGFGGVGKSALALEYAHQNIHLYPGGVWWVSAEGKPAKALAKLAPILRTSAPKSIARKMIANFPNEDDAAEAVRVALQNHQEATLLVLDNIDDPNWHDYIPGGHAKVLTTTRNEQCALGVRTALGVLLPSDAIALACHIAGSPEGAQEARAMEEVILESLDRLAVAVEMAARGVDRWTRSWAKYKSILQSEAERILEHPQLYGHYRRGVFAAIDLSIDQCTPGSLERHLLDGMAIFAPDAIPVEWVESVAEPNIGQTRAWMRALGLKDMEDSVLIVSATGIRKAVPSEWKLEISRAHDKIRSLGLATLDVNKQTLSIHRLVHKRIRERTSRPKPPTLFSMLVQRLRGASPSITLHKSPEDTMLKQSANCISDWLIWKLDPIHAPSIDLHLEHIREVLVSSKKEESIREWLTLVLRLAVHFVGRGSYETALSLLDQVGDPQEFPVELDLDLCLLNQTALGFVLQYLNRDVHARAIPNFEGAAHRSEKHYGPNHRISLACKLNLAYALAITARPCDAYKIVRGFLKTYWSTAGKGRRGGRDLYSRACVIMSIILQSNNKQKVALSMIARAISTYRRSTKNETAPALAPLFTHQAAILATLDRTMAARSSLRRALTINRANYGHTHWLVANDMANIANLSYVSQQSDKVMPRLTKALVIAKRTLPRSHPLCTRICKNIHGYMTSRELTFTDMWIPDMIGFEALTHLAHWHRIGRH